MNVLKSGDLFKKLENFMKLLDYMNEPNWQLSLGEDTSKIHLRNKHYHLVFDPVTGNVPIHYDEIDPHESLESAIKHMWQSKKGRKVLKGAAAEVIAYFLGK